jgi:hypothetical protein
MSHSHSVTALVTSIAATASVLIATAQEPAVRLVGAANVTIRQGPSAQAAAVVSLPLGTEVRQAGDNDLDKTWVHITTPDGREGFVLARLTRPLDPFWTWQTHEQLIVERLGRKGDGFPAAVELVSYIERIADTFSDPDGRARIDLYRLKALQLALAAVPSGRRREPSNSWLTRYEDWAAYDEPGGRWMLRNDAIWKVHDAHARSPLADEIAWLSVTNGLGGECEGYLPCYFGARNALQGEYLRRHPTGVHVMEAVAAIGSTARLFHVPADEGSAYRFERAADCAPLTRELDALESAIQRAAAAPDRDGAIAALTAVRALCR